MIFAEGGRELPIQATLRPDDHFRAQTLEDRYSRDDDFRFAESLYQGLAQSHALVRLTGSFRSPIKYNKPSLYSIVS
jgi:hypothetical protein